MAKLNQQSTSPAAVEQARQSAQPVSFTPQTTASEKKPRKAKTAEDGSPAPVKIKRIRGREWFGENFAGGRENVLQVRTYPARGGFRCAPCGIPGTISYVIRGKEGRGTPQQIMEIVDGVATGKVSETVIGFEVGATCLQKYGDVDMSKPYPVPATEQPAQQPAA